MQGSRSSAPLDLAIRIGISKTPTLVHADYERFPGFEFVLDAGTRKPIYLWRRPHLEEFLDRVAAAYDLAVWTASSADYGRQVLRHTVLDRRVVRALVGDRCIRRFDLALQTWRAIKRLRKVGRDLARVPIVENSPENCEDNHGNCVQVTTHEGGTRAWSSSSSRSTWCTSRTPRFSALSRSGSGCPRSSERRGHDDSLNCGSRILSRRTSPTRTAPGEAISRRVSTWLHMSCRAGPPGGRVTSTLRPGGNRFPRKALFLLRLRDRRSTLPKRGTEGTVGTFSTRAWRIMPEAAPPLR